ncbi:hypothetical protein [Dysgonomonas macrotermitis]|uniref:Uncharacterized protein n=1 Tax=Dysgonomonas macrotermitis TaxID=1346286 RepID=A0A1M5FAP9_9BACT|nr:hypothetical protein [Dysgonomonas macrotermitis]SHF88488.1 hypothetical protein SAMN05444362_111107 [Dysgonomonas macrotermitis]
MIDIKVKIHDAYSFEFKTSFIATKKTTGNETNEFGINTWLFVPNNIDINRSTYSKEQFYKDTKSYIRLITPVYTLQEIYMGESSPLSRLKKAIEDITSDPENAEFQKNYIFQIRMFSSIFKSASRDRAFYIIEEEENDLLNGLIDEYVLHISQIIKRYRDLKPYINHPSISEDNKQYYIFGDDFIGNILQQQTFRLMRGLENMNSFFQVKDKLHNLVVKEDNYKRSQGYSMLDTKDSSNNYLVIMRWGILKKFIESDLFLITKKSKDGAIAEQFFYGIAAGISMIFATVISFSAQLHYGNFTVPLFCALVISYIFKDRIKDLMRYYFSTQLGKKYFDTKRQLDIQHEPIGWTKEAFDYVLESKVPPEVISMRKRSPLVEAENKVYNEQILLYRKLVRLESSKIGTYRGYEFIGINDITRFNIAHYIQKMDNPSIPIYLPDEQDGYVRYSSEKVYALYMVVRCEGSENLYYRKFRLLFNRKGIKEITELKDNQLVQQ